MKGDISTKFLSFVTRHPALIRAAVPPLSYMVQSPSIDETAWDRQYSDGHWDYLSDLAEMPRYAIIAGFTRYLQPVKSILDVGCGSGHLVDWLYRDGVQRYVGIDLSRVAVEKASRVNSEAQFEVAEARTYIPDQRFDVIIFNEVLYYSSEPGAVLDHYERFLNRSGAFIISTFRNPGGVKMWRQCRPRVELVHEVRCRGANGLEWDIRLCHPR
ncbi:class I SAM-dependent methyltransferase [Mycobacterium sp. E136]|uniref:class I SAM-dependent methyltransferase n=1 Tax=Mycobacterium sp. E136 TaxID=1834125 RepID=UPI0018D48326|nr:class I SAM-dependent methyltransferase [Mycobacterium sp. E136]